MRGSLVQCAGQLHFRSDAAPRPHPATLGIPESEARHILVRLETCPDVHHALVPLRFDGAPRRLRRSASARHNRNRRCKVGLGIHDGTSGFGIRGCERSAKDPAQTHSRTPVGRARRQLSRRPAEIVVLSANVDSQCPSDSDSRFCPSPPTPLPQTSLRERGASVKTRGCQVALEVVSQAQSRRPNAVHGYSSCVRLDQPPARNQPPNPLRCRPPERANLRLITCIGGQNRSNP